MNACFVSCNLGLCVCIEIPKQCITSIAWKVLACAKLCDGTTGFLLRTGTHKQEVCWRRVLGTAPREGTLEARPDVLYRGVAAEGCRRRMSFASQQAPKSSKTLKMEHNSLASTRPTAITATTITPRPSPRHASDSPP